MAKGQEAGILLTGRRNNGIFPSYLPWRREGKAGLGVTASIRKVYSLLLFLYDCNKK